MRTLTKIAACLVLIGAAGGCGTETAQKPLAASPTPVVVSQPTSPVPTTTFEPREVPKGADRDCDHAAFPAAEGYGDAYDYCMRLKSKLDNMSKERKLQFLAAEVCRLEHQAISQSQKGSRGKSAESYVQVASMLSGDSSSLHDISRALCKLPKDPRRELPGG